MKTVAYEPADPQETTRGARWLRRTRVEYHCPTQSAGTLVVRTTNLAIDPLLQARNNCNVILPGLTILRRPTTSSGLHLRTDRGTV